MPEFSIWVCSFQVIKQDKDAISRDGFRLWQSHWKKDCSGSEYRKDLSHDGFSNRLFWSSPELDIVFKDSPLSSTELSQSSLPTRAVREARKFVSLWFSNTPQCALRCFDQKMASCIDAAFMITSLHAITISSLAFIHSSYHTAACIAAQLWISPHQQVLLSMTLEGHFRRKFGVSLFGLENWMNMNSGQNTSQTYIIFILIWEIHE